MKVQDIHIKKTAAALKLRKQTLQKREEIWRKNEIEKAGKLKAKCRVFSSLPQKERMVEDELEEREIQSIQGDDIDKDDENDLFTEEKPSYFNCDEIFIESEDEKAAGENNYIEIDAMPLHRRNVP